MMLGAAILMLAAADPNTPVPKDWISFIEGGIITPVALVSGLVMGIVVPSYIYKQVVKERDEYRDAHAALQKLMVDELVPLLTRNVDVLKSIDSKMEPPTFRLKDPG